jgi:hypothetical protein
MSEDPPHLGGYVEGGDKDTWYPSLWSRLIYHYNIKSIMDIGCGEGHSTRWFRDNGCEVLGIEGSLNAILDSPDPTLLVWHDYTEGPYIPKKNYDAIWCCEFVEHVEEQYVDNFLETFKCANYVFMTHALENQGGYHHVNCKSPDYWIDKMDNIGFKYLEKDTLESRLFNRKKPYWKMSGKIFIKKELYEAKNISITSNK